MPVKLVGMLESNECLLSRVKDAVEWVSISVFTVAATNNVLLPQDYQKKLTEKA